MTVRALVLLLALAATGPAAVADEACAGANAALFEQAQHAHRSGRFEAALEYAERLSDCFPNNVDYQYQRALALAALGRDEPALEAARLATRLAPDYEAVGALAERLDARIRARAATAAAPEPKPASDPQPAADAGAAARWTATALVAAHELSGGRDGWNNAAVMLRRTSASGLGIGAGLEVERRGSVSDVSASADLLYPSGSRTRLTGRIGITPGNSFRPGVLVAAGAQHDIADGWVARAELAQRRFESDRADSATLGADYYVGAFRLAGAVTLSRLANAGSALGTVATIDWYASDGHRYRLTASIGDELDTIDESGTVLESRVRSLTFAAEHALSEDLSFGWWLGTVEQGTFYDRRYAGLTVTRRY